MNNYKSLFFASAMVFLIGSVGGNALASEFSAGQAGEKFSEEMPILNKICNEEKTLMEVKRKGSEIIKSLAGVRKYVVSNLISEYESENVDWKCRFIALEQLSLTGDSRLFEVAVKATSDSKVEIRRMGIAALGLTKNIKAAPYLERGINDADAEMRIYSVKGLANIKDPKTVPLLTNLLAREVNLGVRLSIVESIGAFWSKDSVSALERSLLNDTSPEVRARSAWVLGEIRAQASVDALIKALDDKHVLVGLNSAQALGKLKARNSIPGLIKALNRDIVGVAAASALGEIGDSSAIAPLNAVIGTNDEDFKRAIQNAVKKISRK